MTQHVSTLLHLQCEQGEHIRALEQVFFVAQRAAAVKDEEGLRKETWGSIKPIHFSNDDAYTVLDQVHLIYEDSKTLEEQGELNSPWFYGTLSRSVAERVLLCQGLAGG